MRDRLLKRYPNRTSSKTPQMLHQWLTMGSKTLAQEEVLMPLMAATAEEATNLVSVAVVAVSVAVEVAKTSQSDPGNKLWTSPKCGRTLLYP